MKNTVVVFLIFLGSYFSHAQDKDLKKILTAVKWKADIETMKPQLLLKLVSHPEMKDLSKEERELVFKSIFISLEKMRYAFGFDDSFKQYINEETEYAGTFSINSKENELITNLEIEPNSVFKIVSFDSKKVVLHHQLRNTDLILIPEN
jgi:hypothetical protein